MSYLDPWDWIMWAAEELNSSDWEDFTKSYATPMGLAANLVFVVAKANSGKWKSDVDDVFREAYEGSSGWLRWFLGLIVTILSSLSFLNAFYTFYKKRHYRLFEQPIETSPATPSAHRVRVDSSPVAASPLRFLQNVLGSESAASRAHPDAARDVWEIALWDPNPLCLRLFCLFSPLHVILYWLNLPVAPLETRPSVKVVITLSIAALLAVQLSYICSSFAQQIKDSAVIHKEVLNEYDIKFVHPALQRPYRDVGIQTITTKKNNYRDSSVGTGGSELHCEVDTYTPTTIIKRGFRTNPNEAYASQYDPDNLVSQPHFRPSRSNTQTPSRQPAPRARYTTTSTSTAQPAHDFSSPARPTHSTSQSHTPSVALRDSARPSFRPSNIGAGGDGGSLGVYSHAASPLRKSSNKNFMRGDDRGERRGLNAPPVRREREGSPLKRMSTPSGGFAAAEDRSTGLANPFQSMHGRSSAYGGAGMGRRESGRF